MKSQTDTPTPELVALLELSERATQGDWIVQHYGDKSWKLRGPMLPRGGVRRCLATASATSQHETKELDAENEANIRFIAALVNWFRSTRAATAPQGVSVPDGWVLVPREPTPHMVMSAHCAYFDENDASEVEFACMRLSVVAAIDAALPPQQGG